MDFQSFTMGGWMKRGEKGTEQPIGMVVEEVLDKRGEDASGETPKTATGTVALPFALAMRQFIGFQAGLSRGVTSRYLGGYRVWHGW